MLENIMKFLKKLTKRQENSSSSKDTAKERLHLVLMQDRANVSADFLDLMRQEIIDVIKKYIEVDESAIDVRLTNKENADGTNGAPALYANIPIVNIKEEAKKKVNNKESEAKKAEKVEPKKEEPKAQESQKQEETKKKEEAEDKPKAKKESKKAEKETKKSDKTEEKVEEEKEETKKEK